MSAVDAVAGCAATPMGDLGATTVKIESPVGMTCAGSDRSGRRDGSYLGVNPTSNIVIDLAQDWAGTSRPPGPGRPTHANVREPALPGSDSAEQASRFGDVIWWRLLLRSMARTPAVGELTRSRRRVRCATLNGLRPASRPPEHADRRCLPAPRRLGSTAARRAQTGAARSSGVVDARSRVASAGNYLLTGWVVPRSKQPSSRRRIFVAMAGVFISCPTDKFGTTSAQPVA
jgi:hypothetical protein